MAEFTKIDLEESCLTDQLACGLKAGVEGAIHALSDFFAMKTRKMPVACC